MLLDFVRNSIWHAFSTLTEDDGVAAPKSKLKVIHKNIIKLLVKLFS